MASGGVMRFFGPMVAHHARSGHDRGTDVGAKVRAERMPLMSLLLRILSIVAALVCVLTLVAAAFLYVNFTGDNCGEGCEEGMATALVLPVLLLSAISGITSFVAHRVGGTMRKID